MRTVNKYMLSNFAVSFFVTLIVFTFIMCTGILLKANDLLARGVEWQAIFKVLGCAVPAILTFSIPISIMTASLLVMGRLSADGEITAMKTCGISMWRIILYPILFCSLMAVLCIYLSNEIAPKSHLLRRDLISKLGLERPIDLLEEGKFISDFKDMSIYVGKKEGNNLTDIRIYDMSVPGLKREIRAKRGVMKDAVSNNDISLDLYDVRIDPFFGSQDAGFCGKWPIFVKGALKDRKYKLRVEDYSFVELLIRINYSESFFGDMNDEDHRKKKHLAGVELHKRLSLSLSCLAFAMLGIPLGIKAHRKESSIGIAISLVLVFLFYLFIMLAESLAKSSQMKSDYIVWIPVIIAISLGTYLIKRSN